MRDIPAESCALILSSRSARVIPRILFCVLDKVSLTTWFQDILSGFSAASLAATLENLQVVPHYTTGAVLAEARQRACLSVQRK